MTDHQDDTAAHSGVPGMRWGVRKDSSTSSDHAATAKIKRMKGWALSNEHLKTANDRMSLEVQYRGANLKSRKKMSSMSNDELKTVLDRSKRETAYSSRSLRDRLTNRKKLSEMSDKELDAMASRTNLEKQYKDIHYFGKVKNPVFLKDKVLADTVERAKLKQKYKELKSQNISSGEKFIQGMLKNALENKMKAKK